MTQTFVGRSLPGPSRLANHQCKRLGKRMTQIPHPTSRKTNLSLHSPRAGEGHFAGNLNWAVPMT